MRITSSTNFIAFLDSVLQITNITNPTRTLSIPLSIGSFKCDPLMFYAQVDKHKEIFNKENEEFKENEKNYHKEENNKFEKKTKRKKNVKCKPYFRILVLLFLI